MPSSPTQVKRRDGPHISPVPHGCTDRQDSGVLLDPGSYIWPHGKHAGKRMDALPDVLLQAIASSSWYPWQRELAEAVLADRAALAKGADELQAEKPSGELAAVVLPDIVWEWQREMQDEFAGDAAALAVVERGLAKLKALCSRYTGKPWAEGGEG